VVFDFPSAASRPLMENPMDVVKYLLLRIFVF